MISAILKTSGVPMKRLNEKQLEKLLEINKEEQKKFFTVVRAIAINDFLETLDTEGANIGQPWEPLSPGTKLIRQNAGFPPDHPIHVRSSKLRKKIQNGGRWNVRIGRKKSTGNLSFQHKATQSHPGTSDSQPTGNLFEDLHTGYKKRPARPMYDEEGYGVSAQAVEEIEQAFEWLMDDMVNRIEQEMGV